MTPIMLVMVFINCSLKAYIIKGAQYAFILDPLEIIDSTTIFINF